MADHIIRFKSRGLAPRVRIIVPKSASGVVGWPELGHRPKTSDPCWRMKRNHYPQHDD